MNGPLKVPPYPDLGFKYNWALGYSEIQEILMGGFIVSTLLTCIDLLVARHLYNLLEYNNII